MKIQIAGLSEGIHNFQFREPVADIGLGEGYDGDVTVGVMLEKSGKQLFVRRTWRQGGSSLVIAVQSRSHSLYAPRTRCTMFGTLATRRSRIGTKSR